MNKILCKIFGHRWRCLGQWNNIREDGWHGSCMTGWQCDRCDKTEQQQWDF